MCNKIEWNRTGKKSETSFNDHMLTNGSCDFTNVFLISWICRGVIGGKTQRINGKLDITSQSHKRKNQETIKANKGRIASSHEAFSLMAPLKPLTHQQKTYVQDHHCFLVRNYEKVKVFREAFHMIASSKDEEKTTVSVWLFLKHTSDIST